MAGVRFSVPQSPHWLCGLPSWYRGLIPPGLKEAGGVKLTTHLHLVLMSRKVELYFHSSIRFHGVVVN
jgi:hypothetical protein